MKTSKCLHGAALIAGVTIVAVVFPSILEGKSRLGISSKNAQEMLDSFPKQLGDWQCTSDERLTPEVERTLRCYGYINRVYWNPQLGVHVSLAILCGPRGPMAVHTPEICYSSRGRTAIGEPQEITGNAETQGNSFWRLPFKQARSENADLEVWYAWSDGGEWIASSRPRYWMTDSLFKIQLAGPPGVKGQQNSCELLLQKIVPEFRRCLDR